MPAATATHSTISVTRPQQEPNRALTLASPASNLRLHDASRTARGDAGDAFRASRVVHPRIRSKIEFVYRCATDDHEPGRHGHHWTSRPRRAARSGLES